MSGNFTVSTANSAHVAVSGSSHDFSSTVKGRFSHTPICHSLSFYSILHVISYSHNQKDYDNIIKLANALNGVSPSSSTVSLCTGVERKAEIAKAIDDMKAKQASGPAIAECQKLADYFNDTQSNLTIRNSTHSAGWNSSIGKYFDPRGWLHLDGAGKIDSSHEGAATASPAAVHVLSSGATGTLTTRTLPGYANCFCLLDEFDGKLLYSLIHNPAVYTDGEKVTLLSGSHKGVKLLYSSSNKWANPDISEVSVCSDVIYYPSSAGWVRI